MKATGQGVHSTFVDILKIMRLQLTPGKEEKYFSDYIQARTTLDGHITRGKTHEELYVSILDSMFIMGMADRSVLLEKQISEVICSPVWAHAEELIATWSALLITKAQVRSERSDDGALKANVMVINANAVSTSGKQPVCFNCAKEGHVYSKCDVDENICRKCEGKHHTSMHDVVKSFEIARRRRSGSSAGAARTTDRSPAANVRRREAKVDGPRAYAMQVSSGIDESVYDDYLQYQAAEMAELQHEGDIADFGGDLETLNISSHATRVGGYRYTDAEGIWDDAEDPHPTSKTPGPF